MDQISSISLPRIAILMAHSGGGHFTAARSLTEVLEGRAQVRLVNLLDEYAPFPFNRLSMGYGPWVTYAPWTWEMMYQMFTTRRSVEFTQRAAYPLVRKFVAAAFEVERPDLVISVHPVQITIPLRVLREMGISAPFITVVTDPVTAPTVWFDPAADLCIVATEEARTTALQCGVDPAKLAVVGLPIRRAFAEARGRAKTDARRQLGLDPDRRLVLLTGGGAGIGKVLPMARAIARSLSTSNLPVQMAIIAGRNQMLLRRLQEERWPIPVASTGFVHNMADWLAAADLLISKAGPGTLAEAACLGIPVLITGYIPGQEDGNIPWVERCGAGLYEPRIERVAALVAEWLRPGDPTLGRMANAATTLSPFDAAQRIGDMVMALCPTRSLR